MTDKPRVVVTRTRGASQGSKTLGFGRDDVREASGLLGEYRARAWEVFERLPIPDVSLEAWRRTDLRALPASGLRLAESEDDSSVPTSLLNPLAATEHAGQAVLGGAGSSVRLDPAVEAKGVVLLDLETAATERPELLKMVLGQTVNVEEGKFAAMAGALARSGLLLYVPKGVALERPIHSLFWGPEDSVAHLSQLLVYLDENSSGTYVHEFASPTESKPSLHAGIVEVIVAQGASLRFVELQSWGRHIWNFAHKRVRLERDAQVDWVFGAVGSKLTKDFSELDLAGEGASGRLSGFYFTDGDQHLDHDTQQNHLAPRTTSDLLFKGALRGHSRSVWQGMIYVARGASKTDGYQANRNLVLDGRARADSIPGLEILADDVRCTHGATVGKLEPEHLFYLRSRGVPEADAVRILVEGFFDPIMQRIPFEGVRTRFQHAIVEKMNGISAGVPDQEQQTE